MITITEHEKTVTIYSLPEHHYFTGEIGGFHGLFAKLYGGHIIKLDDPSLVFSSTAYVKNYRPVKGLSVEVRKPVELCDIPAGTCFTGKTCAVSGMFIKLPNDGLMRLDPSNLGYISIWGDYSKNNKVTDYCPVDFDIGVSV